MKNQHIITVLENCLRVLDTISDAEFDLSSWRHRCGTTACLIGHCCTDKWFNEQGLRFQNNVPVFHTKVISSGWDAVLNLFELPPYLGRIDFLQLLFSDYTYVKTKRVNVRVRLKRMITLLKEAKPILRSDLGKNLRLPEQPMVIDYFNTHLTETN